MTTKNIFHVFRNPSLFAQIFALAVAYATLYAEAVKSGKLLDPKNPDEPKAPRALSERELEMVSLIRGQFGDDTGHGKFALKFAALVTGNPALEELSMDSAIEIADSLAIRTAELLVALKLATARSGDTPYYVDYLPLVITANPNGHCYDVGDTVLTVPYDLDGDASDMAAIEFDDGDDNVPIHVGDTLPGVRGVRVATVAETKTFFKHLGSRLNPVPAVEFDRNIKAKLRSVEARLAR